MSGFDRSSVYAASRNDNTYSMHNRGNVALKNHEMVTACAGVIPSINVPFYTRRASREEISTTFPEIYYGLKHIYRIYLVRFQDLKLFASGRGAFLDSHAVGACKERPKSEARHTRKCSCHVRKYMILFPFIPPPPRCCYNAFGEKDIHNAGHQDFQSSGHVHV